MKVFDYALLGVHLLGHEMSSYSPTEETSYSDQIGSLLQEFRATHKVSLNWYLDVDAYVASS